LTAAPLTGLLQALNLLERRASISGEPACPLRLRPSARTGAESYPPAQAIVVLDLDYGEI